MSALKATLGLDASSYEKSLKRAAQQAMADGKIIQAALNGTSPTGITAKAQQMRRAQTVREYEERLERKAEGARIFRAKQTEEQIEQARRDIRARALRRQRAEERGTAGGAGYRGAYLGTASTMFVSVARDTAASLASGANPITVAMQQMPQVLQAFTMTTKEALIGFKDAVKSGFTSMLSKIGGAPGAAVAAGGVVAGGWTMMEFYKWAQSERNLTEKEQETGDVEYNLRKRQLAMAQKLYMEGKMTQDDVIAVALAKSHKAAMGFFPNRPNWDKEALAGGSDYIRQLLIEANSDPADRARMLAEFERDRALREVPALAKSSTIPESEFRAAIEARFKSAMASIGSTKSIAQPMSGLRFGSRMELPPGQLELQNNVRDIARNVRDIATKPTAPSEGVKF